MIRDKFINGSEPKIIMFFFFGGGGEEERGHWVNLKKAKEIKLK